MERQVHQEKILDGCGSYSKTDKDCAFLRRKDDRQKNGQTKNHPTTPRSPPRTQLSSTSNTTIRRGTIPKQWSF
ncbi:hypothetical protein [Chryseobacterium koreense]|uniref:hypothetical protein n=1 Tax=Chryseobacterium koreense TaxID=232216 RepID=UPI0026E947CF|nr:hypothetical protein [Chryseobacterium koreense]